MATTFNQTITAGSDRKEMNFTLGSRFKTWLNAQEQERILWTGLGLGLHGCVITPLTFLVVVMSGINMILLIASMIAIVSVLVVNLAALPAKVTVQVFFASVVLDILIIATCAISGFNIS